MNPRNQIVSYQSGTNPGAEGWLFDADKKWLSNFLDTVHPLNNKLPEKQSRGVYAEWERVFDDECPTWTVRFLWPVYVALATRNEF